MPLGPQTWCAGQRAGLGSRSSGSPRSLSLLLPWVWEGVPPTTKWARCFLPDGCRPVGAGPLPVFSRAGAATRSSGTSDPKAPRVNLVPVLPLSSPQKQLSSAQMVLLLPQMSGLPHATVHMSPGCPPLSPSGPGCWVWPQRTPSSQAAVSALPPGHPGDTGRHRPPRWSALSAFGLTALG